VAGAKDYIDIIDTAIKIGLGGLIAWVSSYTVSKLKHDKEKEIYLLDKKLITYESAIDELESYFNELSRVFSYIGGVQKSNSSETKNVTFTEEQTTILLERNKKLVDSWSSRRVAITRLKLLGAEDLALILNKIKNLEKELRAEVIFTSTPPSSDLVDRLRNKKDSLIEDARNEIGCFYQQLIK